MPGTLLDYAPYVGLVGGSWVVWKCVAPILSKSPLDNIPGPSECKSFAAGDMLELFDCARGWDFNQWIVDTYGGVARLHGSFGARILYVSDPCAVHRVFRQQDTYIEPPWHTVSMKMSLGPGILSTEGEEHRRQRKVLNPVFAPENLNVLIPLFNRISQLLADAIRAEIAGGAKSVDVLHWTGRTGLELLAQGGLGTSFDPIIRDPDDPNGVAQASKDFMPAMFHMAAGRVFSPLIEKLGPPSFRDLIARYLPHEKFQHFRKVCYTIHNAGTAILSERKTAIAEEGTKHAHQLGDGKDLMTILLKANMSTEESSRLPDDVLVSQIGSFMFAATDTSSNAASRILQRLAENPEVQQQLRAELQEAEEAHGQDLPSEILLELPLLDGVVRETLRLHPPIPIVGRDAAKDDILPLSVPIRGVDGSTITRIAVPAGTTVMLSHMALNKDKTVWGDDAEDWKPHRWLKPLPDTVSDAQIPGIFSNIMTFGAGKHSCIGYRFALISIKVLIARLVANFQFSPSDEKIVWNFAGITFPSMETHSLNASLKLRVASAIDNSRV